MALRVCVSCPRLCITVLFEVNMQLPIRHLMLRSQSTTARHITIRQLPSALASVMQVVTVNARCGFCSCKNKAHSISWPEVVQVAQLWQRDRASSISDLRWGVNLRLNYRLKGYFSCHCDMTQFTLTHHMVKTISSTRPSC